MTETSTSGQKPADAHSTAELRRNAHVLVLQEMRARFTDTGSPSRTAALDAAISALAAHQLRNTLLPDDPRVVEKIAAEIERGKFDHPGFYRNTQLAEALRRVLDAALSAQPSPGGQGDALLREVSGQLESLDCGACIGSDAPMEDLHGRIAAHLAARQPVCATVKDSLTVGGGQTVGEPAIDYEDLLDQAKDLIHCGCSINGAFDWLLEQLTDGEALAARPAQAADSQPVGRSFQHSVSEWMDKCFLPSLYSNMTERGDRLLEEVLELLQAHGYDKARVPTLVDYVFGRPVGEPAQEVGGVMVTLAGYCWVAGLDMHVHGHAELSRISHPEVMAKIRAKQEAKNALHFDMPLPGNAAPPAQQPAQAVDLPYSLDADPAGIRARVCDVITGTLMVGAQGHTPPPAGHWAEPFWKAARADAAAQAGDLGTGVQAIACERERQLRVEGFSPACDAHYIEGELARAATAYAQLAAMDLQVGTRSHIASHEPPFFWPWAPEWWKPVDARRDLVRAGALIAAQIDLIDRQAVGNG